MYIIHVIMLIFAVIYANDCVTTQTNRPLSNYARKEQRRSWEDLLHKQRKMQFCPLNLDVVLLFLHNSKVAYCATRILPIREWPSYKHLCLIHMTSWRYAPRLQIMLRFILECKAYNRWQEISWQVTTMNTEKTLGRRLITPMTRDVSAKIR